MGSVSKAALPVALLTGGIVAIACHAPQPAGLSHSAATANGSARHAGEVRSNILRADYAGSAACAPCHAEQYAAWLESPMHRMTRDVQRTQIRAPFAGTTFQFRSDSVRLEQQGNERFMRLHSE